LNVSFTYDVRGLIGMTQTAESITKIVRDNLSDRPGNRVAILGGSRILVRTNEIEHFVVSEVLGEMPRNH